MTGKDYLKQVSALYNELITITEMYNKAYIKATGMTSELTDMPRAEHDDRKDEALVIFADISLRLDKHRQWLQEMLGSIFSAICKVPESLHRKILFEYYFNRKTKTEIGQELGFSDSRINQIFTMAVLDFEEVFDMPKLEQKDYTKLQTIANYCKKLTLDK
jgi:DNA-directed RNA polymerase specialized sigma subunit